MSGYVNEGALPDEPEETGHRASVLYIIAASVICGVGLFLIFFWLVTFQWAYFVGVPIVTGGFLLFLSQRAGADHAE